MQPKLHIQPLAAAETHAIEAVLDAAFGPDRRLRTAYRLRTGCTCERDYSFAAFEGDTLVGTLQTWPLALVYPGGRAPLLLVGPVAVLPDSQREGIGRAMMARALGAMDAAQAPPSVLIGDAPYYGRFFGYESGPTQRWHVPGPVERDRLLLRNPRGIELPVDGTLRPAPTSLAA